MTARGWFTAALCSHVARSHDVCRRITSPLWEENVVLRRREKTFSLELPAEIVSEYVLAAGYPLDMEVKLLKR